MTNQIPYCKHLIILIITAFSVACNVDKPSDISIYDTKVNAQTTPSGIDTEKPVFSWKLKSESRSRYQSAFQIVVLDETSRDTCWNSGKIRSDNNIMSRYAGSPLKAANPYLWKVRIWDQDGKISRWSGDNHFDTGLMSENDWKANWISSPESCYSPVFIKEINLEKIPGRATVFVNCQGYFELFVNGAKIGNDVLSPAVSDFRYENYYLTYDIRNHLKTGKNTIGVWTGRGWYSFGLPGVTHQSPVFRLQAHLVTGNSSVIYVTDSTWQTGNSNISQIGSWRWNQMGGELIDDRIPMRDWNDLSFKKDLKNSVRIAKPGAVTRSQSCSTNIISGTIPVKTITQISDQVWLIDFGKNFTGWMKMNIKYQAPGDTIDFIYSDFCNKKPERKSKYNWDFGNASIDQRDAYVCSDAENGIFCPKFNYHAFRYVIIQGLKQAVLAADITGYMIEPDLENGGSFTCSDPDLNAIYELNRFTFRCLSAGGYYVDCPHRERLGYGDGQVAVETGIYNFNLQNFYKKWTGNWISAQDTSGEFPNTAPSPYPAGGGPGWGGTGVVLPWKIFRYYGDTAFLQSSYPSMIAYVKFLESKSKDGILMHYGDQTWGFIGDWVPPGRGMDSSDKVGNPEKALFNNCYKLYLYRILSECAGVLDLDEDSIRYSILAGALKAKINSSFFDAAKGTYANGEQPYLSFPLLMDVPPENEKARVLANLENEIRVTNSGHLNTGMLGTYFMLQYLTGEGRSDLVYLIMKQKTYPGWGYMVASGANTCWEQWNGYWSNIHSCFTSGGGWFYTGVAGIGQIEHSVAFRHLLISPQLTDLIDSQRTEFESPNGKVVVAWNHKRQGNLRMEIEIPANTLADIILPASKSDGVLESEKPITENREIQIISSSPNKLRLRLPSGKYVFDIR